MTIVGRFIATCDPFCCHIVIWYIIIIEILMIGTLRWSRFVFSCSLTRPVAYCFSWGLHFPFTSYENDFFMIRNSCKKKKEKENIPVLYTSYADNHPEGDTISFTVLYSLKGFIKISKQEENLPLQVCIYYEVHPSEWQQYRLFHFFLIVCLHFSK